MNRSKIIGEESTATAPLAEIVAENGVATAVNPERPLEIGGRDGPDPTRYGDWEKNGRCIDF